MTRDNYADADEVHTMRRRLEQLAGEEPAKSDPILQSRINTTVKDFDDICDRYEDHARGRV